MTEVRPFYFFHFLISYLYLPVYIAIGFKAYNSFNLFIFKFEQPLHGGHNLFIQSNKLFIGENDFNNLIPELKREFTLIEKQNFVVVNKVLVLNSAFEFERRMEELNESDIIFILLCVELVFTTVYCTVSSNFRVG